LFLTFCEECHKKRARKLPKSLAVKPLDGTNVIQNGQKEWHRSCSKSFSRSACSDILKSDNGREFSNAIIAELKTCWPELKLVTGRPRHPQSQGAVERLNDKLAICMRENECKRWSMGLKFVQWQINVNVHETTGQSPFKVTFGEEPLIGLESYVLSKSLVDAAKTEE
ncbi:KRAB-A domain-containing protein 2, partial [Trichinella zimbabwensis]